MSEKEKAVPSNREKLSSVRIRTGGVHYTGARIITQLTTDDTAQNIAGSNIVICSLITTHPAGVYFEAKDTGTKFIVPYANVEIATLE